MAQTEHLCNDLGGMRFGNIENAQVCNPALRQLACKQIHRIFRIAIHRGIGQHHTGLLRDIFAPPIILIQNITEILAPNWAMQRTNHFYIDTAKLFQGGLHLRAIFAHNIGIIPARFRKVDPLKILFVAENIPIMRTE